MTKKGLNIHEPLYPPLTMGDVVKEAKVVTSNPRRETIQVDKVSYCK